MRHGVAFGAGVRHALGITPRLAASVALAVAVIGLGACATRSMHSGQQQDRPAQGQPAGTAVFTSARYDIRIRYPAGWELKRKFTDTYQLDTRWKTFTGPDAPPGQPVVALRLPASNGVTAGAIRIGASRDQAAVENCTRPAFAMRPGSLGKTFIDGVPFTTYTAGSAGMSHYLIVHSYRAVHNGACYAIDVLVYGTNPNVYAPPRTPPFTHKQAFARLTPVVTGLEFIGSNENGRGATRLKPPATYEGLLPCADCPGIAYQLNLLRDHRYVLRLIYRDRDAQFRTRGRWHLSDDGRVLNLESDSGHMRQWAVRRGGKRLELLNAHGKPIESQLDFSLHRAAQFQPLP